MPSSPVLVSPNGNAVNVASFASSITVGNPSTAFQAGDILRIAAAIDNSGITISGISSAGLTFTQRAAATAPVSGLTCSLSVWYAVLPAPQTGFSAVLTASSSFDDIATSWCVIRGATSGAPFDPNGSLPAIQTGAPPSAVTYSTTFSDDLIIFDTCGDNDAWLMPPPLKVTPATWAWVNGAGNTGGFGVSTIGLYSRSVSAPQTSQSANLADATTFAAILIVDAFTGDVAAPGVPDDFSCGADTTTSITPTWAQGSGPAPTSYTLQWRQVGTTPWNTITGITGTSQTITGLMPGTSYEWQVEAIGTGGSSGFSTSFVCTTLAIAPAPILPQSLGRWRGLVGINWLGLALVGDAFSGVIGLSDFNNFTEYGNTMRMLVTSPPIRGAERHRLFIPRFEIDMQVGDGLPSAVGLAPVMMLDYSKNGGMTYLGLQKWRSMGQVGKYRTRLRWLNLGASRSWVFRLTCTDPVRRQIIGTYFDQYEGLG